MSLWVRLLVGLGAIVGVILVGEALWPSVGIVGYVVSCVVFSVLAYYVDGLLDRRGRPSRAPTVPMTPYSPAQTTQPTKTQYAPEQVRAMLQRVEERYNAGEIDRTRYAQLLGELVFQDAYGRWWTIDHRNGRWVQNKGGTWVESEPPHGSKSD